MNSLVVSNSIWADGQGFITLNCSEFTRAYRPGQLLMLQIASGGTDPLLKRPFAPYFTDDSGNFGILYQVVGRGTKLLARAREGDILKVGLPHGRPFSLKQNKKVALVAGGIGLAPMHCLALALLNNGNDVTLYYGARNEALIYPPAKTSTSGIKWVFTTDDGSFGKLGFAATYLKEDILSFDFCYATGPGPMMQAVHRLCKAHEVPLEVSLEEVMACGIGACGGCMVKTKKDDLISMKRCCTEGPVFRSDEVYYED